MFNRNPKDEATPLEGAINSLISHLETLEPGTELYQETVAALKVLVEARAIEKTANRKASVSPDVIAAMIGHLAGIAMIIGFEKAHVITSKALPFVQKIR